MNKLKVYILFFLALSCGKIGFCQFTFSGVIYDEDQNTIAGVELFDHVSRMIVMSNEDGIFQFLNLAEGPHQITLFSLEYETETHDIDLRGNTEQNFTLRKLSIELGSVEIAAKRKELFAIKRLNDIEETSIFAGKKTEVVVLDLVQGNLANNNSRQIYAQVSGLNIYEGNEGGLQLNLGGRGLDPNRTSNFNTRQNGYDISADVLGYPENYYSPPAEAISEIRVIRGASSLQYGTQFGGLIDFRIRKAPTYKKVFIDSRQSIGSFGTFNSYNAMGLNKNKVSLNAFYKFKKGDGYRNHANYKSNNLFLSLEYRATDKSSIGLEYTHFDYLAKQAGGLTDQQFKEDPRQSSRTRNWFEIDWNLFSLKYKQQIGAGSNLSLNLFGLFAERNSVGFRGNPIKLNENPITALDEQDVNGDFINPRDLILGQFKNHGAEGRFLNNYNIIDKNAVLLIGAKYYRSNNSSIQGPGSRGEDADFNLRSDLFPDYANQSDFLLPNLNGSLFAENIFYLSERLSLTPGIRLEHIRTASEGVYNQVVFDNAGNPIANNLNEDIRNLKRSFMLLGLGLSYEKSEWMKFIANVSQNYRSVTFSDIRVVSPTFIVDPEIKDERGLTADLGITGVVQKYFTYDLTVFSILYNDRIGIILDNRANRVRKNIGDAIIAGSETLLNFNFGRYLQKENRKYELGMFINSAFTYSRYLESEENNVVGKKVEFIPAMNLKTGLNAGFKNFNISFQYTYLSKQFTDVQNSSAALEGDVRSGIIGEIPSYAVADLTCSYQFKRFKLEMGINNLFDKSYFTRRATGYPGPGIIPSEGRALFITVSYNNEK